MTQKHSQTFSSPLHLLYSSLPAKIQVSFISSLGACTVSLFSVLCSYTATAVCHYSPEKCLGQMGWEGSWKSLSLQALLLLQGAMGCWKSLPLQAPAPVTGCKGMPRHHPSGVELHYQPEHITSFKLLQYI